MRIACKVMQEIAQARGKPLAQVCICSPLSIAVKLLHAIANRLGEMFSCKGPSQDDMVTLLAADQKVRLLYGVLNLVSGFGPTAGAAVAIHMNGDKGLKFAEFKVMK